MGRSPGLTCSLAQRRWHYLKQREYASLSREGWLTSAGTEGQEKSGNSRFGGGHQLRCPYSMYQGLILSHPQCCLQHRTPSSVGSLTLGARLPDDLAQPGLQLPAALLARDENLLLRKRPSGAHTWLSAVCQASLNFFISLPGVSVELNNNHSTVLQLLFPPHSAPANILSFTAVLSQFTTGEGLNSWATTSWQRSVLHLSPAARSSYQQRGE